MKLSLAFKSEAGMYPVRQPVVLGEVAGLLTILQKYAAVDSQCGDRFMYKAVRMLSYALDEAGVQPDDTFDRTNKLLWNLYNRSIKQIQADLAEKMSYIINEFGVNWKLLQLPDHAKFPVQVTFEVRPGVWIAAAIDELGETGNDEGSWVLLGRVESENCASIRTLARFSNNMNRFDLERFKRTLPQLIEWAVSNGNTTPYESDDPGRQACAGPVTQQEAQAEKGADPEG